MSSQTFQIGLSVYGPNSKGLYTAAVSDSEGITSYSGQYDSFAEAKQNGLTRLRTYLEDYDEQSCLG